jgi:hypothetical protein
MGAADDEEARLMQPGEASSEEQEVYEVFLNSFPRIVFFKGLAASGSRRNLRSR